MKSLKNYISEENQQTISLLDMPLNEGILTAIGKGFKKLGEKFANAGEKTDEIKKNFSDAAKKSWELFKKNNPEVDKDKEQEQIATQTLSVVDDAMQQDKDEVNNFSKKNNINVVDLMTTVQNIIIAATVEPKTQFVQEIIASKDTSKMSGLNSMIMGLLAAKKNGIDANQMGALMGVINKQGK